MKSVKADLHLINGHILTQDPDQPQVSQLLVRAGKIQALGSDLSPLTDQQTETLDLQGAVVLPGFIDAHLHFLWGGSSLLSIPLQQATSKASFMALVTEYSRTHQPGDWLLGGGWNEHRLEERCLPHKSWLDEAAPGHPMILQRHDGHSAIASSVALDMAGVNAATPDPQGGVIDRDAGGEPTGILRDSAMGLVMDLQPRLTATQLRRCLDASQRYLLDQGVTAVGDMIHDLDHFEFLQQMARENQLKVRVNVYLPILKWDRIKQLQDQGIFQNEWLQFKGLKGFCDGSLGSHTALMLEPYADTPDSCGIYDTDWSDSGRIETIVTEADQRGCQVAVHAIGDRAVREVLDLYERVIRRNGSRDRRFRVEHAQHIHPDDQKRFKQLGVIASVQPQHCVDDSRYAESLLGPRCSYAYPFSSLTQHQAALALGSDWPVSPADPVATLHGAVHRAGWYLEEALLFHDAVAAHTSGAARACFRELDLGSLRPGHLADFVILDRHILDLPSQPVLEPDLLLAVFSNGIQVQGKPLKLKRPLT